MSVYPESIASELDLLIASDRAVTVLIALLTIDADSAEVMSTELFGASGAITIEDERIQYTSKDATHFLGLVRGTFGSVAAAHASGEQVQGNFIAAHHNNLRIEVQAIETELGVDPAGGYTDVTERLTASDIALSGKALAIHGHAEGDVTNLVTDLAAKQKIFHPADLGTRRIVHLDAALGVTMDGSNRVSSWVDQANNIAYTESTDGNKPVYVASQAAGLPAIKSVAASSQRLFATSDILGAAIGGHMKPIHVFIVFSFTGSAQGTMWSCNPGSTNYIEMLYAGYYGYHSAIAGGADKTIKWKYFGSPPAGCTMISVHHSNYDGRLVSVRMDSTPIVDRGDMYLNNTAMAMKYMSLFCRAYGAGGFATKGPYVSMALFEMIITTSISEEESRQVDEYLNNKYGLNGASGDRNGPLNPGGPSRYSHSGAGPQTLSPTEDFVIWFAALGANCVANLPRLSAGGVNKEFIVYMGTQSGTYYTDVIPYSGDVIKYRGVDLTSWRLTALHDWVHVVGVFDGTSASYSWHVIGLDRHTPQSLGTMINGMTEKVTIADADMFPEMDSADTNKTKRITGANLKSQVLTYGRPTYFRTKLTANTDYYVRTADGSNSNDGSANDAAHAWATPQYAVDYIKKNVDPAGYNITVNVVGNSSANDSIVKITGAIPNIGILTFRGDNTTPSNVTWTSDGYDTVKVYGWSSAQDDNWVADPKMTLHFEGIKLVNTTSRNCLYADDGSVVSFKNLDFGAAAHYHIRACRGAHVIPVGNYIISGSCWAHYDIEDCGALVLGEVTPITITLSGTPNFSNAFAFSNYNGFINVINAASITFSGAATGKRYRVDIGGVIVVSTGSSVFFPGNAAGTSGLTGVYNAVVGGVREQLEATRNYYVRTDGNDSNDGLTNNAAGAFLTPQVAVNAYQALDCNGYDVYINVADGTYTDKNFYITNRVGQGNLYLVGNITTPSSVHINFTTASTLVAAITAIGHPAGSKIYISGFKLTGSGSSGIFVFNGSNIVINGPMEFGAFAYFGIFITLGGYLENLAAWTISGSCMRFLYVNRAGFFQCNTALTYTLTGTPNWSGNFVQMTNLGGAFWGQATFSGACTGKRYLMELNAVMNTNGGGANYFPGDVAGTTATGGQYN
jgi:hypothetical protein